MNYKTYSDSELQEAVDKHAEHLAKTGLEAMAKFASSRPKVEKESDVKALGDILEYEIGNEAQRLLPDADYKTIHTIAHELGLAIFETAMTGMIEERKQEQKSSEENKAS